MLCACRLKKKKKKRCLVGETDFQLNSSYGSSIVEEEIQFPALSNCQRLPFYQSNLITINSWLAKSIYKSKMAQDYRGIEYNIEFICFSVKLFLYKAG